jgi:hypothetical protein
LAWIRTGDGLQINQSLLTETALMGSGPQLKETMQGLGKVADLE